jgi:hypothetical protein
MFVRARGGSNARKRVSRNPTYNVFTSAFEECSTRFGRWILRSGAPESKAMRSLGNPEGSDVVQRPYPMRMQSKSMSVQT